MLPYLLQALILVVALVPLYFLTRRPTEALCSTRNQAYSLTVSPAEEGVIYVAE